MHRRISIAVLVCSSFWATIIPAQETQEQKDRRMQWFADAKLGIFIHWGIYAVNGIEGTQE